MTAAGSLLRKIFASNMRGSPVVQVWVVAAVLALLSVTIIRVTSQATYPQGYGEAAEELPDSHFVQGLVRWDSGWYVDISRRGYDFVARGQSPTAFFPAYPLLVAALSSLGINSYLSGVLISLLCGLLGLVVFTQWARLLKADAIATEAGIVLSLYPFAIYLYGIVYADGLFLLLSASAFLMLERRHLFTAVLLGALATAARPLALAVISGLLIRNWELVRQRGEPRDFRLLLPCFAAAGVVLYMVFLWWRLGDPLAFVHAQSAPGWDNAPGWRTWLKVEWFRVLSETTRPLIVARLGGHALAAAVALLLVVPVARSLGPGYAVYCAFCVGIPAISSHDFQGVGRYAIAAFPLFLVATELLRKRRILLHGWLLLSAVLMFALAFAFGYGGYVA